MTQSTVHTVNLLPDVAGWRLDRALAAALTILSRERLKALIASGAVTRDTMAVRDPAIRVRGCETFEVAVPDPVACANPAQDIPLAIVHEDSHLLVVDKPAGLVVHPAAGNLDGTLVNALLHHCAGRLSGIGGVARPGIVHRIDKDTSGLLVVAKTDRAHEGLARQFAAHSLERRYLALTAGVPRLRAGVIDAPLARSAADRKRMAIVHSGGKRAVTHYQVVRALGHAALVECRLETGRTHQVRVHLTSIGCPILGDPVYGRAARGAGAATALRPLLEQLQFRRQALHAAVLGFSHPVTDENLRFESSLPADMMALLAALPDE